MSSRAGAAVLNESDFFPFTLGLLSIAEFAYIFNTFRRIVRANDPIVPDNHLFEAKPEGVFHFPELIITNIDPQQQGHPDRNFKYLVTLQDIIDFFSVDDQFNRKFFKQNKDGKIEFDKDGSSDDSNGDHFKFLDDMQYYIDLGQNIEIIDYDDAFSTSEGGLTYGLLVNHTQRWLCVVFRGTIGKDDWEANGNFNLDTKGLFPDHASFVGEDDDKPGTHSGFTEYLVSPRPQDKRPYMERLVSSINKAFDPNDDDITNPQLKITNEYGIFVTGHSLGGGLANLFSYHLADLKSRDDNTSARHIPSKIKAVTFAAPVVGNKGYNKKYQQLEKDDHLRHIRIGNSGDPIQGTVPLCFNRFPMKLFVNCFSTIKLDDAHKYTANGVRIDLHLLPEGDFIVDYPGTVKASDYCGLRDLFNLFKTVIKNHSIDEYERRLKIVAANNSDYNIDNIYSNHAGNFTN